MALMKWNPSSKKKLCNSPSSEDLTTCNISTSRNFSNFNPLSQFYCKRIIVENFKGDEPVVTRIEEAMFTCSPQESDYNQRNYLNGKSCSPLIEINNFENQSYSRKRRSKPKSDHKCSKKDTNPHRKGKKPYKDMYQKIVLAVILGCPFLLWWLSTHYWCQAKPLDFLYLETSLKQEVIGQQEAISSLLLNFYKTSNLNSQHPVFLLSGSIGVGKSYVVDLVLKHFPGLGHKESLFYPTPNAENVIKNLKDCEHNLLVIDSLYFKDSQEIALWTEKLHKEATVQRKQVWLVLVFTTELWTSDTTATPYAEFLEEISKISNKIEEIFAGHGISTQLITFKPMEIHNVKECVRKELENLNLLADETQLDQIVKKLTNTPALRQKGCKHVKKYFIHSDNYAGLLKATA